MTLTDSARTAADRALSVASDAALVAYQDAIATYSREKLKSIAMEGADGTPTMFIDIVIEDAIIAAATAAGANACRRSGDGWTSARPSRSSSIRWTDRRTPLPESRCPASAQRS